MFDAHTAKVRCTIALLIAVALTVLTFLVAYRAGGQERNRAAFLDAIGTQRVLLLKIAEAASRSIAADTSEARGIERKALADSAARLTRLHEEILARGKGGKGVGDAWPHIERVYFSSPARLDQQLRDFLANAKTLADANAEAPPFVASRVAQLSEAVDLRLLPALDKAAEECRRDAENNVRAAMAFAAAGAAVVLALLAFLVISFRRLAAALSDDREQIVRLTLELQEAAVSDGLTGALSRRRFDSIIEREVRMISRYDAVLSAILCDVDRFHAINDEFGHHVGDDVLVKTAALIAGGTRNTDFLFRWGGGQFLALLPRTSCDGAMSVAEKLRVSVAEQSTEKGPCVTISSAVAELIASETPDAALARLDAALHLAKEAGGNQVARAFPPEQNPPQQPPTEPHA